MANYNDLLNPFSKREIPTLLYNPFESSSAPPPDNTTQPVQSVTEINEKCINEQFEYYKFLEEKRKREEEDARLAAQLSIPTEKPPVTSTVDDDYLLALKLMQEEENERKRNELARRKSMEQDEAMARKLYEEEMQSSKKNTVKDDAELAALLLAQEQADMEDVRSKEWEKSIELMRYESDCNYTRLLKEKEELEQRLREIESQKIENNVIINLDTVDFPDYWEPQVAPHSSFDVPKDSGEWNKIQNIFHTGLPKNKIYRIERNQNKTLWMWYYLKKQELETKNSGSKGANEQFVFHGSRANAYDIILKEGFDHRVANMSGAIGAGIYFACSSATSSSYVCGSSKYKKMLYCRVLAGDVGQGKVGLRRPPEKKSWFGTKSLYDSVGTEGSVYVLFDNHQCYPEYVIHYE